MPDPGVASDTARKRAFYRFLVPLVILNVLVWAIWAIGDRSGGLPWPVWVSLASVLFILVRGGQLLTGPSTTGRQRNRNRNRR